MSNYINPQSQCILINIPIENDYKNQYSFSSLQAQESFFKSKKVTGKEFTNLTFIRDGEISVEGSYNEIFRANYLMFQNTGFSNKWFYAFITDVDYVNENCSVIHYELDYFQTWYFDIQYKTSFVLREHVEDDSIGKNIIDEGLDFGEYIYKDVEQLIDLNNYGYIICSTEHISDTSPDYEAGVIDNLFDKNYYYYANTRETLAVYIRSFDNTDCILYILAIPKIMLPLNIEPGLQPVLNARNVSCSSNILQNLSSIDGHTIKNNKLKCFPYVAIELTNYIGENVVYRPELFTDYGICHFKIIGNLVGNPSVRIYPLNYKKRLSGSSHEVVDNDDLINEGISLSNFPQVPFTNDFYKNYLALNSYGNNVKLGLNIGNSLLTGGIGLATGNPIGVGMGVYSFSNGIANYMTETHKAEVTPDTAHNVKNGNSLSAKGKLGFYLNYKTITGDYARILDNYFTMFGYKVNEIKVPQFNSRANWNYIETKNINITGNFPQTHLNKIKEMFNHGVTIWHNDNVGNYNRTNPIV